MTQHILSNTVMYHTYHEELTLLASPNLVQFGRVTRDERGNLLSSTSPNINKIPLINMIRDYAALVNIKVREPTNSEDRKHWLNLIFNSPSEINPFLKQIKTIFKEEISADSTRTKTTT